SLASYKSGDYVTFDDTGSTTPAVNLSTTVSPGAFICDSTNNYVIAGSGALSGSMPLTKSGAGTLVMNTTNSFSGAVTINDGTLELGTTTSAGSGTITLNGGSLKLTAPGGPATYNNPVVIASPATVVAPSNQRLSAAISGSGTWNVNATGGTLSIAGSVSGYTGTMVMTGSGTFRWYGSTGNSGASFDLGTSGATMFARDG